MSDTQPNESTELEREIDFCLADQQETINKVLLKRRIMALITQERDRAVLEARYDEVINALNIISFSSNGSEALVAYPVLLKRKVELEVALKKDEKGFSS